MNDMDGKIDAVFDGGACGVGVESTVITLAEDTPRLLRPGRVTLEQLREVLGEVELDSAVLNKLKDGQKAASPGMKYKHYAPKANVILLKCTDDDFINYVNRCGGSGVAALCCDEDARKLCVKYISLGKRNDYEAHAQRLFDSLRRIDGYGNIVTVYTRLPSTDGVGLAVYNRLIRAAGFEVIDLEKS
jgi:L-threonylcarbamoyladenylate synthase